MPSTAHHIEIIVNRIECDGRDLAVAAGVIASSGSRQFDLEFERYQLWTSVARLREAADNLQAVHDRLPGAVAVAAE